MRSFRKLGPVFVYGVVAIVSFSALFLAYKYKLAEDEFVLRFSRSLSAVEVAVDHEDLYTMSDVLGTIEPSEEYNQIKSKLEKLSLLYLSMGVKGYYIMKYDGDEIRFIVDSAPLDDDWHSEPGVVYEEPAPELLDVFEEGRDKFVGPYTDEYGSFYSYFSAIENSDGEIALVIGADITADIFKDQIKKELHTPIFVVIILILGYIFTVWLVAKTLESGDFR